MPIKTALKRSTAVWDLTDIPEDTPLEVDIVLELISNENVVQVPYTLESLSRVSSLVKSLAGFGSNIVIKHQDIALEPFEHVYTYNIRSGDTLQVHILQ